MTLNNINVTGYSPVSGQDIDNKVCSDPLLSEGGCGKSSAMSCSIEYIIVKTKAILNDTLKQENEQGNQ